MMGFETYILKVNLVLVLGWSIYALVFRRFTFFQWNRFYLLGSVALSYLLPLVHWPDGAPLAQVADMHGINWQLSGDMVFLQEPNRLSGVGHTAGPFLLWIYLLGAAATLVFIMHRLIHIRQLCSGARLVGAGRVRVFICPDNSPSFTLFRSIYLGRDVWREGRVHVLRHEKVHASQLHSMDLLFMNFAGVLLWFNPFVYLLMRSIRENHEFLADAPARATREGLQDYLRCLGEESVRRMAPVPASYFKSSTIKKRIIMLTNRHTRRSRLFFYTLTLPVFTLISLAFQTPVDDIQGDAKGRISLIPGMEEQTPETQPSIFPLPSPYRTKVTLGFEREILHPITHKKFTHQGVDIAAPEGTPVYAAAAGVVKKAEMLEGWGNLVVIGHANGYASFYAHLQAFSVKVGDEVKPGQTIATVGNTGLSTGPHLHYEVRKGGEHLDPAEYY